jgi:pimeloyl-ACP methyl ester carboxylesterase
MQRLKGFLNLVFDTIGETTNLVERTHLTVAKRSVRRFVPAGSASSAAEAVNDVHDTVASGAYESIRVVNRGVQALFNFASDAIISQIDAPAHRNQGRLRTPSGSDALGSFSKVVDHAQAAVNGLYGDFLHRRRGDLSLGMTIRHDGRVLPMHRDAFREAFANPHRKICVFVHGLGCTEWMWSMGSEQYYGEPGVHFGSRLDMDAAYTPVFIRYNTGRHISENGRLLSELLSDVLSTYPIDIEEIVVVGHSMGGLVARSAAHYGNADDESWVSKLRHVICIASPHLGAPLEKGTNLLAGVLRKFSSAGTQVPAEILNARSDGIKDLRYGYTIDEEWANKDPDDIFEDDRQNTPLPDKVAYHFLAATITRDPKHPVGRLLGDLLVRVPSAAGYTAEPERRIPFRSGRVLAGVSHLHLVNHPEVYDVILQCVAVDPGNVA